MTTPEKTAVASHISVIVLCLTVAVCCVGLTVGASRIMDGVQASLKTVNAPKSGTFSMLDDTILQGRLTIDATNKVLIHEQNQLGTLDADIENLSSHTDATLTALTGAANGLTTTATRASTAISGVQNHLNPVLDATTTALGSANERIKGLATTQMEINGAIADFDARLNDPNLTKTIANVQNVTGSAALATADFQAKFHDILYPPPCRTFGCKVVRVYPYVKGIAELGEASYWTRQLFENQNP